MQETRNSEKIEEKIQKWETFWGLFPQVTNCSLNSQEPGTEYLPFFSFSLAQYFHEKQAIFLVLPVCKKSQFVNKLLLCYIIKTILPPKFCLDIREEVGWLSVKQMALAG